MKIGSPIFMGNFQGILSADRADAQRFDSQLQILRRAGGRRHIEDRIHFARIKRLTNVLLLKPKSRLIGEMSDVAEVSGRKIVNAEHRVPFAEQAI